MASDGVEYSKLTVAQLKALCKERKISGYSKLGKAALIDKLCGSNGVASTSISPVTNSKAADEATRSSKDTSTPSSSTLKTTPSTSDSSVSSSGYAHTPINQTPQVKHASSRPSDIPTKATSLPRPPLIATVKQTEDAEGRISTHLELPAQRPPQLQPTLTSSAMPPPPVPTKSVPPAVSKSTGTKRSGTPLAKETTKKAKLDSTVSKSSSVLPLLSVPSQALADMATKTPLASGATNGLGKENTPRAVPNTVVHSTLSNTISKRFKPLVFKKQSSAVPNPSPSNAASPSCTSGSSPNFVVSPRYLEISPSLPPPNLSAITLPPPLQHRKRVQRWAVILSHVDEEGCKRCALVSKMFRYAVHLSARERLQRNFDGKRTSQIFQKYPVSTTNFWPYLHYRQNEAQERKKVYTQSFLAKSIHKITSLSSPEIVVSEQLWGCLNDERCLNIALRFLLTRFWFAISIGGGNSEAWLRATIMNTQEVVPGEVWSVSFLPFDSNGRHFTDLVTVYILESTCEVIGNALPTVPRSSDSEDKSQSVTQLPLRADWSSYVQPAAHASGSKTPSLLSQLKWAHQEEYERGISRVWLARITKEEEVGAEKQRVAERYIMACVVANSVSGTWMSTTEMAQEYAGLPDRYGLSTSKSRPRERINLFLPAHHHVESVHFATSTGKPLHPALAVIQTPGREYFILKDNGMEVGCEEDGVAAIWKELLGCDGKGLMLVK